MNKMRFKGRAKQAGFTLIELIVVIVILGIMAATALPKFIDLGTDARVAKMQAAHAAIKTAMASTHGAWTVGGGSLSTTTLTTADGTSVGLAAGYPTTGSILAAAGLSSDYFTVTNPAPAANTIVIAVDEDHQGCKITYKEAIVNAGPPASITSQPAITTAFTATDCD